jgi:hypothetical protein
LIDEKKNLNQQVIYYSESYLLVILVVEWGDVDPDERIDVVFIGEVMHIVGTPSKLHERLIVVFDSGHDSVRFVVLIWRVVFLRIACHVIGI